MSGLDQAILGDPAEDRPELANTNTANDGIYKLVQRVMIILLTDSTVSTNLNIGTEIPSIVFSANVTDPDLLKGRFDQALDGVRDILIGSQQATDPDDEKIDTMAAEVTNVASDETTVDIIVVSQAGTAALVSIPIDNIFNTGEST